MSKNINIKILKDEGEIAVYTKKELLYRHLNKRVVSKKEKGKLFLNEVFLEHAPFCRGDFDVVMVSIEKKALFCKRCGLRISLSCKIETVKDLKNYLNKTYLFE